MSMTQGNSQEVEDANIMLEVVRPFDADERHAATRRVDSPQMICELWEGAVLRLSLVECNAAREQRFAIVPLNEAPQLRQRICVEDW